MMRLKPSSYLILGMLGRGIETGYAVKRAVDRSTRLFWAASFAQVYPELAALERDGHVVGTDAPHGARQRKTYELTAKGRVALGDWLRSEHRPVPRTALRCRLIELLRAREHLVHVPPRVVVRVQRLAVVPRGA